MQSVFTVKSAVRIESRVSPGAPFLLLVFVYFFLINFSQPGRQLAKSSTCLNGSISVLFGRVHPLTKFDRNSHPHK